MFAFKLTTEGVSSGVILTKGALQVAQGQEGDALYRTDAPDGAFRLTPYDPEFVRQIALAEEVMHDDGEVLQALAK